MLCFLFNMWKKQNVLMKAKEVEQECYFELGISEIEFAEINVEIY